MYLIFVIFVRISQKDLIFITFNKIATVPFVYFLTKFMFHEPNAIWSISKLSSKNTIMPLPAIFIIYDFFYTILHWGLHIQAIYGYIHKHHHRQKEKIQSRIKLQAPPLCQGRRQVHSQLRNRPSSGPSKKMTHLSKLLKNMEPRIGS